MVLSSVDSLLRKRVTGKRSDDRPLSAATAQLVAKLLIEEFQYQEKLNELRVDLQNVENFTVCDLYHKLVNSMPMESGLRGIEVHRLRTYL